MKVTSCILLALIGCASAGAVIDPIPGTVPVRPVFEKAAVVCACIVYSTSVHEAWTESNGRSILQRSTLATVGVIDLYKNVKSQPKEIVVQYVRYLDGNEFTGRSRLSLKEGDSVLLFLVPTPQGTFEFADDFISVTFLPSLEKLNGGASGMVKLESALLADARRSSGSETLIALQVLQGFDSLSPETVAAMTEFLEVSDPDRALTALAVVLRSKTAESVSKLLQFLNQYHGSSEPIALIGLGTELGQISDRAALRDLERLSASKYLAIRMGAIDAMRLIRSPHSIPTLVTRLDDSNSMVQYLAVITLAELSGHLDTEHAPSRYLFDQKPSYYRALWKEWWQNEGKLEYEIRSEE